MATFTKFQDILPDPSNAIKATGAIGEIAVPPVPQVDSIGQPFASIKMSQIKTTKQDRTISGKLINRSNSGSKWTIDIKYNPMLKADFGPVYNFLLQKQGSLIPFFISLPQYIAPKDSAFITFIASNTITPTTDPAFPGVTNIEIAAPGWSGDTYSGLPSAGDVFNITDTSNSLHIKTYMITHIETYTADEYLEGNRPASGSIRIHFTPGLQHTYTKATTTIEFDNPLIQVVQKQDIQEYKLNTENLYSFSLRLEEALY